MCLIDTGSELELVNKKEARIQKEEKIEPGESKGRRRELEEDLAVKATRRIKRSSPEEAERYLPLENRAGELFAQYARGNLTYGTDQNSTQLVT